MSRCFPFPPPGYEKKIRSDDSDPLVKEKYKEKKHKKDKEKEGKERKSKDRSKDKQKERKEKKEKHKDRKDKEKDKEKSRPLEEKKAEALTNSGNREKLVANTVQNHSNGESKYVQDLARRIRYEEATGSQSAQKISYPHQNSLGITGKPFDNSRFCPIQETNHREDDDKRINNAQKNFAVAKSSENSVARVSFGADQKRSDAMGKAMEKRDHERQTESPDKSHRKESVTKSDKPRNIEGVKKNEAKDKDRNKEKTEEKTDLINKTRQEKPKLIGGPKLEEREKNSLDIRNCKPSDLPRANGKNLISEGNLGKRKDHETNGFLYENGTTPYKLQRHSASVSSAENGRTSGAHRTPLPASEVQGTTCKPEVKEVQINGFIVSGEKQKVCPPNPLAATMKVKVKENGEASAKPPHPDLKYLNQILNVPKRELLLDDDQEWLFGQSGVQLKKARTDSPDSGESLQVWNQAFRIESADIAALPYVVPF